MKILNSLIAWRSNPKHFILKSIDPEKAFSTTSLRATEQHCCLKLQRTSFWNIGRVSIVFWIRTANQDYNCYLCQFPNFENKEISLRLHISEDFVFFIVVKNIGIFQIFFFNIHYLNIHKWSLQSFSHEWRDLQFNVDCGRKYI